MGWLWQQSRLEVLCAVRGCGVNLHFLGSAEELSRS